MSDSTVRFPTTDTWVNDRPECKPFGTRYLVDETRVWDYNAWDNVDWSDEMERRALQAVDAQKAHAVDNLRAKKLIEEPSKQWDAFYSKHTNNFFKDRKWLLKEFPELDMANYPEDSTIRILEVGCGVGNTSYPLLMWDKHHRLFIYSCDYSYVAVQALKRDVKYDQSRIYGFVWDITEDAPRDAPDENSLDYVVCIYVISAIHPSKVRKAIDNLIRLLKPGGMLLFKDYGKFDLTQLRFKKERYIEENLYCRGDGTLVYFFNKDELDALLQSSGLIKKTSILDKRLIVNRAKRVKMYRQWLQNKKSLLRLSSETLRFRSVFDDLLKAPEIRKLLAHSELKGDIYLTYVLFYEFLVGAGLEKASARVKAVINKYSKAIHDREKSLAVIGRGIAAVKENEKPRQFARFIPRYARVNTLRWTMREAVERLIYEGWKVVFLTAADDFAHEVKNMSGYQVFVDPHIENLLVFPQSADFYSYWLVEQGYLILQDKASCLPAYLLSPSLDSHVFDACAAPGMKTSHVAAILRGGGRVWAMDRSENRVKIMTKLLKQCGAENISILHGDFLKIDINDKRFSKVNYAIVDPPCSGSGMVKRMDELTGQNFTPERLKKLKNLQAMILKHALKFPYLKRLVYSTCSVHEEENEQVVDEVLY
ncbi:methyltransferase domain protein [Dictyocaulus viviparus]|uniref:tRNA N(3)-cytidine methyltransferase METTL6 n=1 Tax=Dictyocaulus viviparus TaxID=29172 RepID=A0A0D8X8E7_DICVI|nr:methyltransferase domain protein [Dictyocaulus viviparus]